MCHLHLLGSVREDKHARKAAQDYLTYLHDDHGHILFVFISMCGMQPSKYPKLELHGYLESPLLQFKAQSLFNILKFVSD